MPIPLDIDYTRTLGYGAVGFLLTPPGSPDVAEGGLVCLDHGRLRALPFPDLRDPETGLTRVRTVDLKSEHYAAARKYMIRLESRDLTNPGQLTRLAAAANITPEDFQMTYGPVVGLTRTAPSHSFAAVEPVGAVGDG
jgi:6-phosphofructokinase 1